jgi:hypothetical protein
MNFLVDLSSTKYWGNLVATIILMLSRHAYTKAIADNPEIRLKQILQDPKDSINSPTTGEINGAVKHC